ncbi:MAG: hypothetical protein EB121_05350, partial [Alphaproteobacteria bacterium]|nr:hypothetical protein [Alphaproteobacteria bacterium]
MGAGLSWGAAL